MKATTSLLFSIFAFAANSLPAATLLLPGASEGDQGLSTPVGVMPRTIQFVYDSSLLADVPLGAEINGLAFRLDRPGTTLWPSVSHTWTHYEIQVSSSLNNPGSLSLTYADNIGSDVVTVRSGPLTISAGAYPDGATHTTPNEFGPEITFTTPYTYTGNDLLITIRHTGSGGTITWMDAMKDVDGLHQGLYSTLEGAYTAETADDGGYAPVVQLFYVIPEPATAALLIGAGALAVIGWRKRT